MKDNNENISVVFFRQGKSYYFKYNDEACEEIKSYTLNKLREHLNIPFKVKFIGMSKAQVGRVIRTLLDNTTDVSIKKINSEKDNLLRYEANFFHSKKTIGVYKVPNESCLYGKTFNCNPFLYIETDDKKVLIEVSKTYAKNNIESCYFMVEDLSKLEQTFFDSCYTELECDYVYRIERTLSTGNQKVKNIKKKHLKK